MSNYNDHDRAARAAKPIFERQLIIKNMFVGHDRFAETTRAVAEFHMPVAGGIHDVGSLFVLAGNPRTGKTEALERYADAFPALQGESGMIRPVVFVSMPIEGRRRPVLEVLGAALNVDMGSRVSDDNIEIRIVRALREQKVQLLIIDEYQEAFNSGNARMVRLCNGLVRKILNLRTLNIVLSGLVETYHMINSEKQLRGRGLLPHFVVTPYDWNNKNERNVFRLLCDAFDDRLPFLEKSGLASARTAHRLYWIADGTIGGLTDFLFLAGCRAMNDGSPRILDHHFASAWDRVKPVGTSFSPFRDDMGNAPEVEPSAPPTKRSVPRRTDVSFTKAR